jgi:hypothetical protein
MEENNKKIILVALVFAIVVIFLTVLSLIFILNTSNKGSLTVTSSPSDATVFIDDKEKGKTPLTIEKLKTGKHKVTVKKEVLSDTTKEVEVKKGENKIALTLSPSTVNGEVFKNKLLVLNAKFEIRQSGQNNYSIALKAIYNRPNQYDSYIEQLKEYKKEALAWLQANNVDPAKVQIEYIPKEAEGL